jgi:hypothetical protein
VNTKPHGRGGHSPRWAAQPEKIINNNDEGRKYRTDSNKKKGIKINKIRRVK